MEVIRITKLMSDGDDRGNAGDKRLAGERTPIWAILKENQRFHWLFGGNASGRACVAKLGPEDWIVEFGGEDEFERIPPEEWPDQVCAAVAARMLVGEA